MFTLQNAQEIIALLTRLLAYFLVITPAGAFRAWVSKKMGDPTAAQMGLISLNPIVHIDVVGIICLIIFGFGWGRQVPVNPSAITGRCRTAKLVLASFSGIAVYLVQAVLYIVLLALIFGGTLQIFMNAEASSFTLVIRNIFVTGAMLSIFLSIIEFAFKGVMLIVMVLSEKQYIEPQHIWYILFLVPILLLLFLGQPLQNVLISKIFQLADGIARFFGVT